MRLGVVGMLPNTMASESGSQSEENRTIGVSGGGVVNFLPNDFRTFNKEQFESVLSQGLNGFGHHFGGDPKSVTEDECARGRAIWESLGLDLAQFLLLYEECLFDPNEAIRQRIVEKISEGNRVARLLGAGVHLIRPGSRNPAGPWTPHPNNHTDESISLFVETLRQIGANAEANGVTVVVECHVVSIMRSPDVCAQVIEQVGSPNIRLVMDPVNHFESIQQAFNATEHLGYIFDVLGPVSPIGHAKDIIVGNNLITHLDEGAPGDGVLDYATFLTRFQEYNPEGYLLFEHIPPEKIPGAVAHLRRVADEVGVEIS
ncbi:MAG: sugar phosphate isomerase/epimerase [Candidatus Latescibacteria bacterium]|jgi:sugar phosphate isomerase/epimerase|nr:sugar phosphate isomerase/epimerase [Candidatus Latescibacterota bacterium]